MSWIPATPAGTPLFDLESETKEEAIKKLVEATAHMPYNKDWATLQLRGYTVEEFT